MNMGWPTAIVLVALLFTGVSVYATIVAARGAEADREAKGKYGAQYKELAGQYEGLAAEIRDAQQGMRTDLAAVRTSVESIEQMMRDVG